jgi:hypothetical protein
MAGAEGIDLCQIDSGAPSGKAFMRAKSVACLPKCPARVFEASGGPQRCGAAIDRHRRAANTQDALRWVGAGANPVGCSLGILSREIHSVSGHCVTSLSEPQLKLRIWMEAGTRARRKTRNRSIARYAGLCVR